MSRIVKTVLCAAGALLLACTLYPRGEQAEADAPSGTSAPQAEQEDSALLFPGLNAKTITAITVLTPDRSFRFAAQDGSRVSVNDRQADREIYMTLVSQIAELPVSPSEDFSAGDAKLLLTLTVSDGDGQHTASFYEDNGSCETARIIAGSKSAPLYAQTDGWRVGTLMMTCEGTRVQDEAGNEQPLSP